jgi:hypothetical protein
MWRSFVPLLLGAFLVGPVAAAEKAAGGPGWSINATVIEACSCPMFCQCYFNPKPAGHHRHGGAEQHFCRFNNVYKVNKGHYGSAKLDGAKFWLAGDLGSEFDDGVMEWTVVTFDKATSKEQREGLTEIINHIFPVKWKSLTTAEGAIDWSYDKDKAHATLDGGKTAEVKLTRFQGMTDDPVVIKNLKYWGVPRNEGFVMMPNEVEAYRVGPKAFEFKGTNGFMLTIDMNSNDVAGSGKGM